MNSPALFIPRLLLLAVSEIFQDVCAQIRGLIAHRPDIPRMLPKAFILMIAISLLSSIGVAQQIGSEHIGVLPELASVESFSVAYDVGNATTKLASALNPRNTENAGFSLAAIASLKDLNRFGTIVNFLLASIMAYGLWYYKTFVTTSRSGAGEPRLYPYWIPFVGHTISLARDPQGVVTRARKYFGDSRNPFRMYAFGVDFAFVTNPKHVSEVYRHTEVLTHDVFLEELLEAFRVSPFARRQIFFEPNKDSSGLQLLGKNPSYRSLARLTVDLFREQLQPGPKLYKLVDVTLDSINRATTWSSMAGTRCVLNDVEKTGDAFRDISLLNWCEDLLLKAANLTFFGGKLEELTPDILLKFLEFDSRSWKAMFRVPGFLSGDMIQYREKIVAAIEKYFDLPEDERKGANWFIEQQEAEMRNLGISTHDLSRCIAMIFWVINTNAYKLLFWMLHHLFQDLQLLVRVTSELRQVYEDGNWDVERLSDMLMMPYTNAIFYECLRITNSSSSARHVIKDTVIGGHVIRAGMRVLVPYRQIHYDDAVYPETETFRPSRFLLRLEPTGTVILNEGLTQYNGSYRPFGGGRWLCPGRHIAKIEIFMAMAYLLCRFDIEASPEQEFTKLPQMDETMPGIGIVAPVKGTDLRLRVRERKDWSSFEKQFKAATSYPIEATLDDASVETVTRKPVDPGHKRALASYSARLKQINASPQDTNGSV